MAGAGRDTGSCSAPMGKSPSQAAPHDADQMFSDTGVGELTDNVTDWCLAEFRSHYGDESITKDDIWSYLYGVMHAPDWRAQYAPDLRRSYPRVPFARDFEAFCVAGAELLTIHADYESVPESGQVLCLVDGVEDSGGSDPSVYRIDKKMRWRDKSSKTELVLNDRCCLTGIPLAAHQYQVSGRSPLDWAVDQLQVKSYKVGKDECGEQVYIADDANGWAGWADAPFELVRHLRRLVWLSVRTAEIVDGLPPALNEASEDGSVFELSAEPHQPSFATAG